jgi:hypothetical protein
MLDLCGAAQIMYFIYSHLKPEAKLAKDAK